MNSSLLNRNERKVPSIHFSHFMSFKYLPPVSVERFLAYPTLSTGCPLCDAVAEILLNPAIKDPEEVSSLMELDRRVLSDAVLVETGMHLSDLIYAVRLARIKQYIVEHPREKLRDVARRFGYTCYRGLWVFLHSKQLKKACKSL